MSQVIPGESQISAFSFPFVGLRIQCIWQYYKSFEDVQNVNIHQILSCFIILERRFFYDLTLRLLSRSLHLFD